jgi:hypothetical protein
LDSVFGAGGRQRCVCHKLGNLWDAVVDKEAHKSIRQEAGEIYDVETAEEARRRLAEFAWVWRDREPQAVALLVSGFEETLRFLLVPRAHRRWVTTTNPIERYIRELRRRTRPMGTFQSLGSCRRLIYVTIWKLSDERRNAIPYSLWTSQPWYARGRRRRRPRRRRLAVGLARRGRRSGTRRILPNEAIWRRRGRWGAARARARHLRFAGEPAAVLAASPRLGSPRRGENREMRQ